MTPPYRMAAAACLFSATFAFSGAAASEPKGAGITPACLGTTQVSDLTGQDVIAAGELCRAPATPDKQGTVFLPFLLASIAAGAGAAYYGRQSALDLPI